MRKFLFRNLGWKLLSLAIAILLWLTLAHEPELATSLAAPIQYRNLPDDLDISSDLPDHVTLEVRGPSSQLTPSRLAGVAVVLNMSSVQSAGERTFDISDQDTKLPLGVNFYRAVPSQIRIKFEHLITLDIPVKPRYSKGPPEGYHIEQEEIDPPTVSVIGPESHVEAEKFVQTDPIDLSEITSEATRQVHIFVGDPQLRLQDATSVTYKVVIAKTVKGKRR